MKTKLKNYALQVTEWLEKQIKRQADYFHISEGEMLARAFLRNNSREYAKAMGRKVAGFETKGN